MNLEHKHSLLNVLLPTNRSIPYMYVQGVHCVMWFVRNEGSPIC